MTAIDNPGTTPTEAIVDIQLNLKVPCALRRGVGPDGIIGVRPDETSLKRNLIPILHEAIAKLEAELAAAAAKLADEAGTVEKFTVIS